MKIAHIIPVWLDRMGGLQVCVHNVSERLAQDGCDIAVHACGVKSVKFDAGYRLEKMPRFYVHKALFSVSARFLSRYIDRVQVKHGFDVWQVNSGFPYGAMLAGYFESRRIPSVLRCCGDDLQVDEAIAYGVRRDAMIDRIVRQTYGHFTACVAISETVAQEYRRLGVKEEKIHVIPNGVDCDRLKPTGRNLEDIREKHGIPMGARVLLSVGRNHVKKGYESIPAILDGLVASGFPVYWVVVGRGCGALYERFSGWKHRDRLIVVEELSPEVAGMVPCEELVRYYQQADIFVMLSRIETFGIVLVEAMAAGLPVVCFDVPGVRDVMKEQCGEKLVLGDEDGVVGAIGKLLNDRRYSEACSRCAQDHARAFSWDGVAQKYRDLYVKCIDAAQK